MKKNGILNRDINEVLGKLGHTDMILIADLGLPIPEHVKCVDLTLKQGDPRFLDVLNVITDEMVIEKFYVSKDISEMNRDIETAIQKLLADIPSEYMKHEDFKKLSKDVKLIIRTGENTPYANIILQSACLF